MAVKVFGQSAMGGGIALAFTLGSLGWAVLRNWLQPSNDPHIDDLLRQARAAFREKQKGLRAALESVDATQSVTQLDSYHEKRRTLIELLDAKFSGDDLNKDRYLAICDGVHAGLLSNLGIEVNMRKSIAHTDPADLARRLESAQAAADYDHGAAVSLKERLQNIQQIERNAGLLRAANEQALAAMDSSIFELSMLDISGVDSFSRLEGAIAKLENLVAQAHKNSSRLNLSTESEGEA